MIKRQQHETLFGQQRLSGESAKTSTAVIGKPYSSKKGLEDVSAVLEGIAPGDPPKPSELEPINKDFLTPRDHAYNKVCALINEFQLVPMLLSKVLSKSAQRSCCVKGNLLTIQSELSELTIAFELVVCCPECRYLTIDPMNSLTEEVQS